MAIVKMSNFSLFAFDSERESLLHELQKFKFVHFLDLEKEESLKEIGLQSVEVPEAIVAIDEEISKVNYAIEIFSKYYTRETGIKALKNGQENYNFIELEEKANSIDYTPIYNRLREVWNKREGFHQEIDKFATRIEELKPWKSLNTPIKDVKSLDQSEIFIGTIPKKLRTKLEEELLSTRYTYFEVISEDKDNLYVVAITAKSEAETLNDILRNNNFSAVSLIGDSTPDDEIASSNESIKQLQSEIESCEQEVKALSENLPSFEIMYEYFNNQKLRTAASEKFLKTENVDVIQGYIPTHMVDEF